MPSKLLRLLLALAGLALVGESAALAQVAPAGIGIPATGYKVGTITVKFVGTANVNEQVVRANMQVHPGSDLDESILDHDIRNLYKTGLFEFIQIKREAVGDRTFNLVVEVTPKFRVLGVLFSGNKHYKSSRLLKEIKTRANTALDERQVKEDSESLRTFYQKKGYNQVVVTYKVQRDPLTGFGSIVFVVREGPKVRIQNVLFVGNAHIKSKVLRKQMDTRRWWIFSWLTGHGRFQDDKFEDDLDKLRDYYREHGYLDIDISEDKVLFQYPKPGRLVIVIALDEGRQYHIGAISFSGNKLHSSDLLGRVVRQKTGMVFAPSKLDKDTARLEDFYGKDGYLDTHVRLVRRPNLATGNIDIEYQIEESGKFYVEAINIEGNSKTKSVVLLRELALGPGDVFDTVRMKASKLRLENTKYFDDVNLSPETTPIPGRRDLRVAVHEGRTGSVSLGAGYSTLEGATITAEFQESNFDIFNTSGDFQGAGQKFRIRLTLGALTNEAVISFDEPWLFQKQLGTGISVYREGSNYLSDYYDEIDFGATVYLRKMLFEQIAATLSYTYSIIDIDNVSPLASPIILEAAGDTSESRIALDFVRDTRNSLVKLPTKGDRVEFTTTVAGGPFGGENNYIKWEYRGSKFFTIFDTQTQVLSIITRAGVIQNYGSSTNVPFYDAFYLGGPDDLRGFDFRAVSPRDAFGEPVGGKTYGLFSAEYSVVVVDPVRVAAFYDAGFVNPDSYDFNVGNYQDDFGVGVRIIVMGAPLTVDYAWPLRTDNFFNNNQGGQFNFGFSTRF